MPLLTGHLTHLLFIKKEYKSMRGSAVSGEVQATLSFFQDCCLFAAFFDPEKTSGSTVPSGTPLNPILPSESLVTRKFCPKWALSPGLSLAPNRLTRPTKATDGRCFERVFLSLPGPILLAIFRLGFCWLNSFLFVMFVKKIGFAYYY